MAVCQKCANPDLDWANLVPTLVPRQKGKTLYRDLVPKVPRRPCTKLSRKPCTKVGGRAQEVPCAKLLLYQSWRPGPGGRLQWAQTGPSNLVPNLVPELARGGLKLCLVQGRTFGARLLYIYIYIYTYLVYMDIFQHTRSRMRTHFIVPMVCGITTFVITHSVRLSIVRVGWGLCGRGRLGTS